MKRLLTYLIITIVLVVLTAFLAGTAWLFGTTAGARRLLDTVSRHTDIKISADKIEGKLAGTLRLENMTIQWPEGKIGIQHLELCTRPSDLLTGQLNIPNLSLTNVSISDNTPDKPPTLIWPQASGLIKFMSGKIGRLEINNLSYRHLDKQPLQFQKINASVDWHNTHLSIGLLQMASDSGVVRGNILAGFNRPLLEMDFTATPVHPPAGMEFFRLAGKFGPGQHAGELDGSFRLSGLQNKQVLWDMSVESGMTSEGFPLRRIRLHRPGRPGLVTADGMLTLSGPDPFLTLAARAADIDLAPDFKVPTNISGSLTFAGSLKQYQGRFALSNKGNGWQSIRLAGNYAGNAESVTASAIQGSALGGELGGHLNIGWPNGITVKGEITGRNLNPAGLDPNWAGIINFDLSGKVSIPPQQAMSGEVVCTLRQSRLHGQQLTGDLRATFTEDDIRIQHLALQGKGFQLTAAGTVKNKLDFTARISDLSRLVPGTAGRLTAQGWARWQNGQPGGVISAGAVGLKAGGLEIAAANLSAAINDQDRSPLHMNATLSKVRYQSLQADKVTLQAGGTIQEHELFAVLRFGRYETHLALSGSYRQNSWQGKVTRLDGADSIGPWRLVQPAALSITSNSLSLEPLTITGRDSESIKISGNLISEPLTGSLTLSWNAVNLDRADAWLNQERLTGTSSGNLQLKLLPQKRLTLTGKCSARGIIQVEGQTINVRQSEITLDANEQGIRAGLDIRLAQGGTLQGAFTSSSPAGLALPDEGTCNLHWQGLHLAPFSSWLPGNAKLEGQMAGELSGKLLANRRFDLTGRAALAQSKVHWQGQKGDVSVHLRDASLTFVWRDEAFRGDMTVTLADYGKLQGRLSLPVAARFPMVMDDRGALQASLTGQVREKGALGVLFPGLVQESRGDLDVDLKISGSPAEPLVSGNAHLSKAGAYLPTAGITVKDAQIAARLTRDTIHIDSFRAVSGPGYIEGSVLIRLKGWQVIGYEGQLNGERFQTIYFPEIQVQSSPKLTFAGTTEKISIRGEVVLPTVQIIGSQSGGPVQGSPDVIREGKTKPAARKSPVNLDVQVKMILGDQVHFKGSGIDADLGGHIELQFREIEKTAGRGEIRVVKGRFRTYGVNLEIVRGRLFYAGGPINQPVLDILALRKVGDVKAGVAVSGTIQKPLIKLYSEPPMQDMDILAYIVLGHPLGSDTRQASLLATAAGALLTSQQSESLLNQIKNRLGLSTLGISTDVVAQNGQMGYKRINITPAQTSVAGSSGSVSETMLVVGKYLTPQLYISYGRSLFSGGNLFFLRYDISKSWQIETQTGQQSGVDIYYKLEFN